MAPGLQFAHRCDTPSEGPGVTFLVNNVGKSVLFELNGSAASGKADECEPELFSEPARK